MTIIQLTEKVAAFREPTDSIFNNTCFLRWSGCQHSSGKHYMHATVWYKKLLKSQQGRRTKNLTRKLVDNTVTPTEIDWRKSNNRVLLRWKRIFELHQICLFVK